MKTFQSSKKIKEKDVGTSLLYLIGSNICHCFRKRNEFKGFAKEAWTIQ